MNPEEIATFIKNIRTGATVSVHFNDDCGISRNMRNAKILSKLKRWEGWTLILDDLDGNASGTAAIPQSNIVSITK